MAKITVLGAGMVGRAIAVDLSANHDVTSYDYSEEALAKLIAKSSKVNCKVADLTAAAAVQGAIAEAELVVCAVPGAFGYNTLKTIIEAGKNVVDISFFPEESLDLDQLAKDNGVTAIVDCGVAPGMDNIILGHYDQKWSVKEFECYVGGLPKERKWPFEYKAPFSPSDVIEEYLRPARLVEGGQVVTRPALSEPELMQFPPVGELEAFNTDGLRSLIKTMSHIPDMKEKTLRYPGHIELIRVFRESGFLSEEKMTINGVEMKPIDLTSSLLFEQWKLGETEPEFTVMRVIVKGDDNAQVTYDLYDEFDSASGFSSMARTTGYTATAAVEFFLAGNVEAHGVLPPELIGGIDGCLDFFLEYQSARGIKYVRS